MKIKLPPFFVGYGPVGHACATVHTLSLGGEERVAHELHTHLRRVSRSVGDVPVVFFDENKGLAEQGYFVLPVEDGEVSDACLTALPSPAMYTPATAGEPGRQLAMFESALPGYLLLGQLQVWEAGTAACDHDLGLESAEVVFKTEDGEVVPHVDIRNDVGTGSFFYRFKCTRCPHTVAVPEME